MNRNVQVNCYGTRVPTQLFSALMKNQVPKASPVDNRPVSVTDTLFGASRIRPRGWSPTPENRQSVIDTVGRFVKLGLPIQIISMVGAAKHLCMSDQEEPDFAEVMMLLRFTGLHDAVTQIYSPGIQVQIVTEDFGEKYLAPKAQFQQQRIDIYLERLRQLARVLAPGVVEVVPESELWLRREVPNHLTDVISGGEPKKSISWEEFSKCADFLGEKFCRYISGKACVEELRAIGFQGDICAEQLTFYKSRACNASVQMLSDEEQNQYVADYLGAGMTRHLLGLLRPANEDDYGPIPQLKGSFVQHAPGTPLNCQRHRLEYVAHPRKKNSDRKVAPWCGSGVVRLKEGELTILTVRELSTLSLSKLGVVTLERDDSEKVELFLHGLN